MVGHRSSAVPLAAAFAALIAYASLYPFSDWTWPPGHGFVALLQLPWPRYFIRFDIVANLLGYIPLGALVYGGMVRGGGRALRAFVAALLLSALLSYAMEVTQNFLPPRVPSLLDLATNAAGAAIGAVLAA